MLRTVLLACIAWAGALPALADPIVVVGDHLLLPDTPNQSIAVYVSGGQAVQGLNFYSQLGPDPWATDGPVLSSLDILTGTIFAGNNTGAIDVEQAFGVDLPMFEGRTTTTLSGSVAATGLLGTITIDTSGIQSGTWDLRLEDTANGPTTFAGVPISITDGSIRVVPEPTAALLGLLAVVSLATLRRRGR